MIRVIRYALLLILAMMLQTVLFPLWGYSSMTPHMVLAMVLALAMRSERIPGLIMGLLCGLPLDLLYTSGIGLMTLPLCVAGYWGGYMRRWAEDSWLFPPVVGAVSGLGMKGFEIVLRRFMGQAVAVSWALPGRIVASALLTGIATFVIYVFCHVCREARRKRRARADWLNQRKGPLT